jgi:hypothetical protein
MVLFRRVGASVSASTPSGGAGPGGRVGRGGGRDHVVCSVEWPRRATGTDNRAHGAHRHYNAQPFDRPRDDWADGFPIPDRLSFGFAFSFSFALSLGFTVSFSLTESIKA